MIKRLLVFLISCMSMLPVLAQAQSAAFDTSRMQRDLEIMEAILDRLFDGSGSHHFFGEQRSRGILLPGYGVFFTVARNDMSFHIFMEAPSPGEPVVTPRPDKTESRSRSHVSIKRRQEDKSTRAELQSFFANYADAIGQIHDNERVAVYLTGGAGFAFAAPEEMAFSMRDEAREIFAAARKADIVARRSGRLGAEEFNQRLQFREVKEDEKDTDLEVMARIFDTALRGSRKSPRQINIETQPIYLEGLGALFLLRAGFEGPSIFELMEATPAPDVNERQDIERHVIELKSASKRAKSDWKTEYKNLRNRFAEIIADYGHTLRKLQGNDWIVIATSLRGAPEDGPREMICRVQKQHIDAYNNRSISRDHLIKKIDYFEY